MDIAFCPACGVSVDGGDNFCRHCGASTGRGQLPAVRTAALPVAWRPTVSPVVKGAAVMAAGTAGQFLLRRVVGGFTGGGRRRAINVRRPRGGDGMVDEAQIITETVMMRRVRIRRPE